MKAFEFYSPMRIVFGRGTFGRAGELAAQFGRRALVIYNGDHQVEKLIALLSSAGVSTIVRRQRGEPVVADVDLAVLEAQKAGVDVVIGLGGGSAIDAAKAAAALLANGGSAVDYMEVVGKGLKITRPSIPWIAIPTTAGTGAEATRNSVIGLPERKFKASIRSDLMLARVALVDPELGVDVPPEVTARSGADALCQLIESYTSTGANPITDALALAGIPMAAQSLTKAFHNGNNLAARGEMAMAALLSGMTLSSAGLGAVHGFAAPLGANFPVPHGTVCAALLPWVVSANIAALQRLEGETRDRMSARYATVGRAAFKKDDLSEGIAIGSLIAFTVELARELKIPPLSEFGLAESDIPEMVALARKASSMKFNPVALTDEELTWILRGGILGAEEFAG